MANDIWHLLLRRGITLWTIWIERNHMVFNQRSYLISKVKYTIYDIEYHLLFGVTQCYDFLLTMYSLPSINVNPREWIKVNIYRGVNN